MKTMSDRVELGIVVRIELRSPEMKALTTTLGITLIAEIPPIWTGTLINRGTTILLTWGEGQPP